MKKISSMIMMMAIAMCAMAQSYPQKVYLTGTATPVGWETNKLSMYNNGDGTYEYVGMLYNEEFGNEFKMLGAPDWLPSYGPVTGGTAIAVGENYALEVRENYEMNDNKFTVANSGRYHLTLNLAENKLYVDTANAELADKKGDLQYLYLVGNGCGAGWEAANAIALTTEDENVYTLTTTIYGHLPAPEEEYNEFKFLSAQSWAWPQIGPKEDGEEFKGEGTYEISVFYEGDKKWHNTSTETKVYTFTINLAAGTMVVANQTTGLENANVNTNVNKVVRNGMLVIVKDGVEYNVCGQKL